MDSAHNSPIPSVNIVLVQKLFKLFYKIENEEMFLNTYEASVTLVPKQMI